MAKTRTAAGLAHQWIGCLKGPNAFRNIERDPEAAKPQILKSMEGWLDIPGFTPVEVTAEVLRIAGEERPSLDWQGDPNIVARQREVAASHAEREGVLAEPGGNALAQLMRAHERTKADS